MREVTVWLCSLSEFQEFGLALLNGFFREMMTEAQLGFILLRICDILFLFTLFYKLKKITLTANHSLFG